MAEESVVSLRTLLLGGEISESWVRVAGAGNSRLVKLPWPENQPSEPLKVIHDGSLKIFRSVKGAAGGKADGEVPHDVDLPDKAKEVLLLGMVDAGKIRFVAIEDTFMEAKFNDWLAINVSEQPVEITVGNMENPVRIDAGASITFQPGMEEGKGGKVNAQFMYRGEMRTFLSTYWAAVSGERAIIIFIQYGERIRVHRIGDKFIRE